MNKRNSFVILVLSASFLLAACGEGESSSAATTSESSATSIESSTLLGVHTVTFETNGGSTIDPVTVADGDKVARPADPVKMGATFVDWYEDEACVTVFDFETPIHADITLFAEWDVEASSQSESVEPEGNYIYFKDAAWWNNYAPSVHVSFEEIDPSSATEFGTQMTWIVYDEVGKFNYWCVEVPEEATGLMFIRTYTDAETEELKYGGSCTSFLELPTDDKDMFVLDGTEWTAEATGHWDVYEGEDPSSSSEDTSEDTSEGGETTDPYGPDGAEKASWYLVGEGQCFTGWTIATGLQLWENPGSTDKGCALNVTFAVGDAFKVTDGADIWFGYEKVDPYQDPSNAGLTCFEGVDDGFGGKNFSCTVAGVYDMYVNKDGVFWIQVHA